MSDKLRPADGSKSGVDRRTFVTQVAGASLAAAASARPAWGTAAADRVRIGVIGCGGRGTSVGRGFSELPGVEIVAVCDPDRDHLAEASKVMKTTNAHLDMRKILDDSSVDAVIIATPDHWHSPAAILACDAGKHVYVEKPCSHNVREGRLLVEAARRNQRLVQHGTQSRSIEGMANAVEMLKSGAIGDVLVAKVINSQERSNIGHAGPSEPPANLDFDLWVGPAPRGDYQPNLLHYNWHWFFPYGTGDIGNDGVHQLDVARWGLGVDGHPVRATGWAKKLFFDDDQQFPDSYLITYEYPGDKTRALIFEQRIWTNYNTEECENGNIFYGTDGKMILNRGRLKIVGKKNKVVREDSFPGSDRTHFENFLSAIREGTKLNAEIEIGHYASTLAHLGNIVARTGRNVTFDPQSETITQDAEANTLVTREYRDGHWAVPKGVS